MSLATDIQQAGDRALEVQSGWARRKDTITAFIVWLSYVATGANAVDWQDMAQAAPYVGTVVIGLIGIGIHALTKGSVTPAVVDEMTRQAEYIGRHRSVE